MLLTGDLITGTEAHRIGLATAVVPECDIDAETQRWANKVATVPANQLAMHKLLVNSTMEGLQTSQLIATIFDGIARHSPEGAAFKKLAETHGWREAIRARDAGKAKL